MIRAKPHASRVLGGQVRPAPATRPPPAPAVHRTILLVDVEGFGNPRRTGPHQVAIRDGLYHCLEQALAQANVPWADCYREDRGDGIFVLVSPDVPKALFVESLPRALVDALREHNATRPAEQRIRLRMALHAGEVRYDAHGATSTGVILAFRLLDSLALKQALAGSSGVLALIVSSWFFDEVVRESPICDSAAYQETEVVTKEGNTGAWIYLPDQAYPQIGEHRWSGSTPSGAGPVRVRMNPPRGRSAAVPRQLPAPPMAFVGREREIARLTELAAVDWQNRDGMVVAAIEGMGGIGKTWLALHWAHRNINLFPDGQLYVDLRGFDHCGSPTTPATAVRGFLDALRVEPESIPVDFEAQAALYRSLVADRQMLVVLDNARDSAQVYPLLPGSRKCTVLVTSRNRLAGLATAHGAEQLALDVFDRSEALEVLVQRLGHAKVADNPDAVHQVLNHCGGLPLALGIIAAQAAVHANFDLKMVADGLHRVSDPLEALDSGDLNAVLGAVLSWSYRALSPAVARMFRLLGTAPGPDIGLPAAASLAALPASRAFSLLYSLENAHLVQQLEPGRFRMHDLVRLYAAGRAEDEGPESENRAALRRVLSYYLRASYAGERQLFPDRKAITIAENVGQVELLPPGDNGTALSWFEAEHPCLLAAQAVAEREGWDVLVWQFAWTMHGYLWRRGHVRDQLTTWRVGYLAAERLRSPTVQVLAHRLLGQALTRAGMHGEALHHLHEALRLATEANDAHGRARAHYDLAWLYRNGDHRRAVAHATTALDLFAMMDNAVWQAEALAEIGWHQARLGYYDEAEKVCERALALFRMRANRQGEATALDILGYIAHHRGRYDIALSRYGESLTLCRDLGARYHETDTLDHLGQAHVALRQYAEARRAWQNAINLSYAQHRTDDAERLRRQLAGLDAPYVAAGEPLPGPDQGAGELSRYPALGSDLETPVARLTNCSPTGQQVY